MGRRSRQRGARAPEAPPAPARPAREPRPRPPWHPLPLVELCVGVGLVLCVWGLIEIASSRGRILLATGMALGSLGGLDTALREHFAGFRSHTAVLACLPAVLVAGLLFFAEAPFALHLLATVAVFAAAFTALRSAFRRKSGGLSFR